MTAPRLVRLWVRLLAPGELRESILDDLDELARRETPDGHRSSRGRAWWRYWHETLRGTPHLIRLRLESARPARALFFDGIARDVRHAWRGLRHEPMFAMTATLTVAIGIGTITTVFSIVDAELWKPLPFPNPHELVKVYTRVGERGTVVAISGAEYLAWRDGSPAFDALAADGLVSRQTLQLETAHSVLVSHVTANYFDVLKRSVVAGRTFTDVDSRGARSAVLTDRAWRRVFAAAPGTVGRSVRLDGEHIDIVGIVQANDSRGGDADLFVALDEHAPAFLDRGNPIFFGAIGRLEPGADRSLARAQVDAVAAQIAKAHPAADPGRAIQVDDLSEFYKSSQWRPLYFLLGAALVVLLVSAVNVAALVLGRACGRTREFALRGALGGGQAAVARQLLVEGALLALPAGALGVLFAQWTVGAIAVRLDVLLRGTDIPLDYRVAAFACGMSALTTLLFALTPLASMRRLDLSAALGPGGRTGRSIAEGRARVALLTSQLALTMVLLSGAAILLKSFVALTTVPPGFDPTNLLAVRAPLGGPRYGSDGQLREYADRMLAAALAVPGVRTAAVGSSSPLGSGPLVNLAFADQPGPAAGNEPRAIIRAVSHGYFRTLGIPIVRGREFSTSDVAGAPRVAIVNETLAKQIAPDGDAIDRTIDLLPGARASWTRRPGTLTIVGVAANVKEVALNEAPFANIHVPLAQMPPASIELLARTAVPPAGVSGDLRRIIAEIDRAVPIGPIAAFDERIDRALRPDRFNLQLISGFAAIGVMLAGVGIYGAIAYAVQARTRELGVRLALGARPARLVTSAVWRACRIGLAGGALGLAGTLVLARAIGNALYLVPGSHNGLLYGVTTTDPLMLTAAFAGINAVAILAAIVPARRIAQVDPVRALRNE